MARDNNILIIEATKRPIYATDGFEYVRTEPGKGDGNERFKGFIKTSKGESQVAPSNELLNNVLFQGKEITKQTYERKEIEALNAFAFEDE